jgi:hypothetical protein
MSVMHGASLLVCSVAEKKARAQVIDDEEKWEDGPDEIEASEESWLNTSAAKLSGHEVGMKDKGKGKAQSTITSLLPKLPLGEPQLTPSPVQI